jgi:hypothetical protein
MRRNLEEQLGASRTRTADAGQSVEKNPLGQVVVAHHPPMEGLKYRHVVRHPPLDLAS